MYILLEQPIVFFQECAVFYRGIYVCMWYKEGVYASMHANMRYIYMQY